MKELKLRSMEYSPFKTERKEKIVDLDMVKVINWYPGNNLIEVAYTDRTVIRVQYDEIRNKKKDIRNIKKVLTKDGRFSFIKKRKIGQVRGWVRTKLRKDMGE